MAQSIWQSCLNSLQSDLPVQQYCTWLRPLQSEETDTTLILYAPNSFVLDWKLEHHALKRAESSYADYKKPGQAISLDQLINDLGS